MNECKRFLVKVTYREGVHKGESYLLRKGGYVTDEKSYEWEDTTYATEAIAKAVCTKYKKNNDLEREIERKEEAYRISKGKKPKTFYNYFYCDYEPYAVDITGRR